MKTIATLVLMTGMACAGPTRAKDDYNLYPQYRRQIALHNIKNILSDEQCSTSDFRVNEQGLHCTVWSHEVGGTVTGHYFWEEIESVRCLGQQLLIDGKYDDLKIPTIGPSWVSPHPQCLDLEEAFRIYLEERKK